MKKYKIEKEEKKWKGHVIYDYTVFRRALFEWVFVNYFSSHDGLKRAEKWIEKDKADRKEPKIETFYY